MILIHALLLLFMLELVVPNINSSINCHLPMQTKSLRKRIPGVALISDDDLGMLKTIKGFNFEVVKMGTVVTKE